MYRGCRENMRKKASQSVWGASPAGWTFAEGAEPGTKEFFERVLSKRSSYEQPWLFELVPFSSSRNQKVLELGCGAGYDAYEFCRNGADYTGIDITSENPERTRKHLGFYGYAPRVIRGDAEELSFKGSCFDTVFSNGVLHHTPDIGKSFREAHRVLKMGGEFWLVVYHKNSVFYWITLFLASYILLGEFLKMTLRERLSRIECSTSSEHPIVNVYTRRVLEKHLKSSGFHVEAIWSRKLVKEDFPFAHLLRHMWRLIPQRGLDLIAKQFGWYLIAKSVKA